MVATDSSFVDTWASARVIDQENQRVAFVIRRQSGSGEHLDVTWGNDNDKFRMFHRSGDEHGDTSQGIDNGASSCGGSYVDLDNGDGAGTTVTGTAAGTDMVVRWFDLGPCTDLYNNCEDCTQESGDPDGICDEAGLIDLADYTTWGAATYECDWAEIDVLHPAAFSGLDDAGQCGISARSTTTDAPDEPNVDDVRCGEIL
jgi:hypothetical protein